MEVGEPALHAGRSDSPVSPLRVSPVSVKPVFRPAEQATQAAPVPSGVRTGTLAELVSGKTFAMGEIWTTTNGLDQKEEKCFYPVAA